MSDIIAILRGVKPDEVAKIAERLVATGVTKIEVPMNSPSPLDSVKVLVREFSDVAQIGAGTVLKTSDVQSLADLGAHMVISPNANVDVIEATKAAGLKSYPGVFTPTECFAALEAGADALKLFPASLIGVAGLTAIKAVLPGTVQIYPVGGVGPENFSEWIAAGVTGFGIGSAIYKPGDSADDVEAKAQLIMSSI